MAAEQSIGNTNGWVVDRIAEVRADPEHQAKVRRIRAAVAAGTFEGHVTTPADLDRLGEEIRS